MCLASEAMSEIRKLKSGIRGHTLDVRSGIAGKVSEIRGQKVESRGRRARTTGSGSELR